MFEIFYKIKKKENKEGRAGGKEKGRKEEMEGGRVERWKEKAGQSQGFSGKVKNLYVR